MQIINKSSFSLKYCIYLLNFNINAENVENIEIILYFWQKILGQK